MNESARAVVLSVLVAACSCSAVAAVTSTGTWNFEGTAANTSPGAAADWFSPGNWSGGAACPDGNVYIRAVMDVAGMTGCR